LLTVEVASKAVILRRMTLQFGRREPRESGGSRRGWQARSCARD